MPHGFTVHDAARASATGRLAEWVREFLHAQYPHAIPADRSPPQDGTWYGPVIFPLARLERTPSGDLHDGQAWVQRVGGMVAGLQEGWGPPPLIVQCRNGKLNIQDGNHRRAALLANGETHYYVIFHFAAPSDRLAFDAEHAPFVVPCDA